MFFRRKDKQPTEKMLRIISEHRARQRDTVSIGAIYHGKCIGCIYVKDNDSRAGIEWCLGCRYSNFDIRIPDRSATLPNDINV